VLLVRLTRDIPIVFSDVADPESTGLVGSLRAPGRNATGVSSRFLETVGKRLELLKEIRPGSRALALVIRKESPWGTFMREAVALSSRRLDLLVREVSVSETPDEKQLVQALKETDADAFLPSDVFLPLPLWVQIQTTAGMPGLFSTSAIVRAGGLLSVGPDQLDQFRRKVAIAARILRGERPSHLPVDQATVIEIALNRKTATAFGWKVPSSVLMRANEIVG
jgi:putative ABC transport system substrate-binding protein